MASASFSSRLEKVLRYFITDQKQEHTACDHCACHRKVGQIFESDTWWQLDALRRKLCELSPEVEVPPDVREDLDVVTAYRNSHALLTSTTSITPSVTLQDLASKDAKAVRISCWRGDITTLTDVTAIVNAANSRMLGCFVPEHRCIDNVIHSAAGPRLREACYSIMSLQDHPEPVGRAKVTPGFQLPAHWILHTVGPRLGPRETPQPHHKRQLVSCYHSCLDAAEALPPLPDGRKVVAFCCISTGLFSFPSDIAARLAVDAVSTWYLAHPTTGITDVIFNTFLEKDQVIYQNILSSLQNTHEHTISPSLTPQYLPSTPTNLTTKARTWIQEADALILTAGAGLSAAAGLDYTSQSLFAKYFPAFHAKGLRKLYDVFGYNGWGSPAEKWGYYFLHLNMVRKWPQSPIYAKLRDLVTRFPGKSFIRTTNADGFFVKNGFAEEVIATPQGQYKFLQCFDKCRPNAYAPSEPYIDAALPFIEPETQILTDDSKIPKCRFCGGEMTICVRGGNYFNAEPFKYQEREWRRFVHGLESGLEFGIGDGDELVSPPAQRVVVLELGVGLNTPGVLRWPNEDLISGSEDKIFRLIRVGMEASGCVPWELEEQDLAVGISGDIQVALDLITP